MERGQVFALTVAAALNTVAAPFAALFVDPGEVRRIDEELQRRRREAEHDAIAIRIITEGWRQRRSVERRRTR